MTSRHQLIHWAYSDPAEKNAEHFVPGDPSLWKVIEEGVGKLEFRVFDGVLADWGDDVSGGPAPLSAAAWSELLTFPGISTVEFNETSLSLSIQVRSKSRYADDLVSLLQSYFSASKVPAPKVTQKIRIITVVGTKIEKASALKSSLEKLVLFGAKSGLFDPVFQDARIVGPGDSLAWFHEAVEDDGYLVPFMDYIRIARRHPLTAKFVIKETGTKFTEGDIVTTVSPLDILSSARDTNAPTFQRGSDPLTLVLGLQARYSSEYSNIVQRELELATGFRERGVSLAYATELYPFASFLEIYDGFRETYLKNFEPVSPNSYLYISRPFDVRNSIEARKFERFC